MGNPFVHIELTTSDVGRAKSFYKSLFDWKLKDVPMGGGQTYTMVDVGMISGTFKDRIAYQDVVDPTYLERAHASLAAR